MTLGRDKVPQTYESHPRISLVCFRSKAKNAQEAHEAIRPTQPSLKPELLPAAMPAQSKLLYSLIWRRTLASQMQQATFRQAGILECLKSPLEEMVSCWLEWPPICTEQRLQHQGSMINEKGFSIGRLA